MNLDQEKLDVRIKTRSNPFNWRGQFTPELISAIENPKAKQDIALLSEALKTYSRKLTYNEKIYHHFSFVVNFYL